MQSSAFRILIAFTVILLLAFTYLTDPIHVTGHLKGFSNRIHPCSGKISVFMKADQKVLAQTFADDKGRFDLTFVPNSENSFDFFCLVPGDDTILLASYKYFDSDEPEITLNIPALRKKDPSGKIICPKCEKADQVYEIMFTDGIPDHFDDDTSIRTPHANPHIVDGYYYQGCIVTIARNYCDRDNVTF